MIVTGDGEVAGLCRSLRNQGRGLDGEWLSHPRAGYNYRMTEMQAALGTAQLKRLDELLERRRSVADVYENSLSEVPGVRTLSDGRPPSSWFVYVILLQEDRNRDRIQNELEKNGIETGRYFPPIHRQPFYRNRFPERDDSFPVTEDVSSRTIALPFHTDLTQEQVSRVVSTLKAAVSGEV